MNIRAIIAAMSLLLISACVETSGDTSPTSRSSVPLLSGSFDPIDPPQNYYTGFGSQWYLTIDSWGAGGSGKSRFFELTSSDLSRLRGVGARVIRMQLHFAGAVFAEQCNWRREIGFDGRNRCYSAAFSNASSNNWRDQVAALDEFSENPVIQRYVSAIKRLNSAGFHAILTPTNFYWGTERSGDLKLGDRYLERDPNFQDFYVAWVNRLVFEMARNGVGNFSLQSVNEPVFCRGGPSRSQTRRWQSLERRIFDGARQAAPGIHLISAATCGGGSDYFLAGFSKSGPGMNIDRVLPAHSIENVSYSMHMRHPRVLHRAYDYPLRSGFSVRYPYQPLDETAGANGGARGEIRRYNQEKPDAAYYDNMFKALRAAESRTGRSIVITEWSIGRPHTGIPRADRNRLARDVLVASRRYGIPIIWSGIFEKDGLSANRLVRGTPRSDFDPQLMDAFRSVAR